MQICRQGNGHYLSGINNQDFFFAEKSVKLITDGCSSGSFSEVGTRLFCQLFSTLETRFEVDKFEENVKEVFARICALTGEDSGEAFSNFIIDNMLFTIIACFELEDRFIVKFIGDGYIITVNAENLVSFIRLNYGKAPPYYSYNMIQTNTYPSELGFKTFEFSKSDFKKVGIASDGVAPIAEKRISESFDDFFLGKKSIYTPEGIIKANHSSFYDDVTILF